jgi:hypothetical protein
VDVPLLRIDALELLVGEVAVFFPLLFLGDPEVDERAVPDVGEAHLARNVTAVFGHAIPQMRGDVSSRLLPPGSRK